MALSLWSGTPEPRVLFVAALGAGVAVLWGGARSRAGSLGLIVLVGGILAGFVAHRQVERIRTDWSGYWSTREEQVGESLNAELQEREKAAEAAADTLAALAARNAATDEQVAELRRRDGVSALALYDPSGALVSWDGSHRGEIPTEAKGGTRRYVFGDLPLFSYLYVTSSAGTAGTAVAAILLSTELPPSLSADAGDFASRFRREVGEGIRIVKDPPSGLGGWDLRLGDQTLFTVVLDQPQAAVRVAEVRNRWRVRVGVLAIVAWIFLALGAPEGLGWGLTAAFTLVFISGALPFHHLEVLRPFFDTNRFSLPGPKLIPLGRLAAMVLGVVTVVAVFPRPRERIRPWVAGVIAAVGFTLLLWVMKSGLAPGTLAQGTVYWILYQGVAMLLLTLLTGAVLVRVKPISGKRATWQLPVGVLLGFVLGAVSTLFVWHTANVPTWWPLAWGVPVALAAAALPGWPGWRRSPASWVLAGLLAASAAVPVAWGSRVQARIQAGDARLNRVEARNDPPVERALYRLAEAADSLDGADEKGVDMMYDAWAASDLASLGQTAWLTLWSQAGVPQQELRVGVAERPPVSQDAFDQDTLRGPVVVAYDRDDARYVLRVPLSGGQVLTVAVPPFADPNAGTRLSPLLAGGRQTDTDPLTIIPRAAYQLGTPGQLRWTRTADGWQGETALRFPNATYRAHYEVSLPGGLLAVARGTLLLLLDVSFFLFFWLVGRALLREGNPLRVHLRDLVISFRARVTLALFGFFTLANVIFGTVAYRAIAEASHRAAQVLAERATDDAAGWYFEVSGRMEALARRVGAELLDYRRGALQAGSVQELVDLGLYEEWIPLSTERLLEQEAIRATTESSLGEWTYTTSYRRLPTGDVIAAQVPIRAGATAAGASDVAELVGFTVVVGAVLSLMLALLVGRALTSPIHALQVASERVGAGNLGLRLPAGRADEFGSVFQAFNRMVRRLRRARRQLVRTTRRTRAIMEEAAVGMLALDSARRVTLVNPRAEALLGASVNVGQPLPVGDASGDSLARWVDIFLDAERTESGGDLQIGGRRFRVRARRLGTHAAKGGAVVAIEDVTDELRTERVLAWGEMARQVAHEVKNPLTPIKLSIQHIRRAWDDRKPDFGDVLVRNADAMLQEIDRLAAIAQSFSRFGAPGDPETVPVSAVDLAKVVGEVLALYEGSHGPVRFERHVDEGLPLVRARVPELKEVLVNLLENARYAVKGGGVVRVEVRSEGPEVVLLEVVDDGAGIPTEIMARVFEPQFSTRSTGTGLGLAIVRRLVESWGAWVGLESGGGLGTRVSVHLAAWDAQPDHGGGDPQPDRTS
ncbi:MAG: HAMP domain-containing protein [Gemmatimonadetes bacterium]|nr:HAMP domain-containing protein [Gemmatimonadota bacterium]